MEDIRPPGCPASSGPRPKTRAHRLPSPIR